jgi:hypothetical protein
VFIVKPFPSREGRQPVLLLIVGILLHYTYNFYLLVLTMAVALTAREQEFLARSNVTISSIDPLKVKNKVIEDDSSKQYDANKNRQGRR